MCLKILDTCFNRSEPSDDAFAISYYIHILQASHEIFWVSPQQRLITKDWREKINISGIYMP